MIFVITGSQKFQFNRLLQELDKLVDNGSIKQEVFAQTGYSDYIPKFYRFKNFMDRDEFADMQTKSDIVITHGGTGAIIGAVKKGKKVIAVPRLAVYSEHVDDHQVQLLKQFDEMNIIAPCYELSELGSIIQGINSKEFNPYFSNTETIISDIIEFIEK